MPEQNALRVWTEEEITVQREKKIRRVSFKNLTYELAAAFNLDKGLLHTLVGLTLRPAQTIRSYLDTERDLVVSPIKYFLFIVGTILFIAAQNGYFEGQSSLEEGFEIGMRVNGQEADETKKEFSKILGNAYQDYFVRYQNVWSIITILFTSFLSRFFFKRSGYNFLEHGVVNAYVFVHSYLLFGVIALFNLKDSTWLTPYFLYFFALTLVVYHQLFGESWLRTTFKTVFIILLSILIFFVIIALGTIALVFYLLKTKGEL